MPGIGAPPDKRQQGDVFGPAPEGPLDLNAAKAAFNERVSPLTKEERAQIEELGTEKTVKFEFKEEEKDIRGEIRFEKDSQNMRSTKITIHFEADTEYDVTGEVYSASLDSKRAVEWWKSLRDLNDPRFIATQLSAFHQKLARAKAESRENERNPSFTSGLKEVLEEAFPILHRDILLRLAETRPRVNKVLKSGYERERKGTEGSANGTFEGKI
ncbi:MAG: hypothetical protein Q7R81_01175 [Candidatus Peregrinibacteria bacterium]|nr:hypothetical protein [Candidatus Peregrinibacteria bacterium]